MPTLDEMRKKANPYGYNVGTGMIERAFAEGVTLLSDELYHDPQDLDPEKGRVAVSEAFTTGGRLYYHRATGTIFDPFVPTATAPVPK